jgi:hypothetical protein
MHTTQRISIDQLRELVSAIYNQGDVVVKQAYSDFDSVAREFPDAQKLMKDMAYQVGQPVALFTYAIYYPEAIGYVYEKRMTLIPECCDGHTFRFTQEGWGLIHLWSRFQDYPIIECSVTVNSPIRAWTWFDIYPDHRNPDLWDWDVIKAKAGRLVRLLRKYGKT